MVTTTTLAQRLMELPAEARAAFISQQAPDDQAVIERALALEFGIGWRATPATMAAHLDHRPDGTKEPGLHFELFPYAEMLGRKFADAVEGRSTRQIWNLPPQFGKSRLASQWGPTWALHMHPDRNFMLVAYGDRLTRRNSLAVLRFLRTHKASLDVSLVRDQQQQDRFSTAEGGGLLATTIDGEATGFGAHGVIIDDPFKNWQEAHSANRRRHVLNQYRSVFRMRLTVDDAFVILVMCLAGDTRIPLEDGRWVQVRDVVAGDSVQALDGDRVAPRKVLGIRSSGFDDTLVIRTARLSVTVNAAHPFLVVPADGHARPRYKPAWRSAGQLHVGDLVVTACDLPTFGRPPLPGWETERRAWLLGFLFGDGWVTTWARVNRNKSTGAISHSRSWCVCAALGVDEALNSRVAGEIEDTFGRRPRRCDGPRYWRLDANRAGRELDALGLHAGVGALKKRIPEWVFGMPTEWQRAFLKGLLDADGHKLKVGRGWRLVSGNGNLVEDARLLALSCGVRPAQVLVRSHTSHPPHSSAPLRRDFWSCLFTFEDGRGQSLVTGPIPSQVRVERIKAIDHGARQEVFDLAVDGPENFVAEGFVVHNTRWHREDLAGELYAEGLSGEGEEWELVRIAEVAEAADPQADDPVLRLADPLGREPGQILEERRFSSVAVAGRRLAAGPYLWSGMHQQRPSPEEGNEIKRDWWVIDDAIPPAFDEVITCLAAGSIIFTEAGPRPIEQVRVDDRVWSLDEYGKAMRLARVFQSRCSGSDELLRITTNGRTLRCNGSHRLLVRRKFSAPRSGSGGYKAVQWRTVWLPASEVTPSDYLVAAHGLPDQVGETAPNGRVLTEGFMALAGLMIGDGSVLRSTVSLARHPEAPYRATYERFAEQEFRCVRGTRLGISRGLPVEATGPIHWSSSPGGCGSFGSRSAARELRELGLSGTAMTKRVPEWVFGLRPHLVLALLRGYVDSDGAINERGHITFSSANRFLLEDMRHLCFMLAIPTSPVVRSNEAGSYMIQGRSGSRRDGYQLHLSDITANRRIGSHSTPKAARLAAVRRGVRGRGETHVDRWQPDYLGAGPEGSRPGEGFTTPGALVRVKSVLRESPELVYDLAVEGTHSFVADGLIVHNSWDMKLKDKETGDYVVGGTWGRTGSSFWLYAILRGQWNQPTTENAIALAAVREPRARMHIIENTGNGPEVMEALRQAKPGYEVSDEIAGLLGMTESEREAVTEMRRRGIPNLVPENVKGDKSVRMRAHSGLIEARSVHLWSAMTGLPAFLEELSAFPQGANDDQVDMTSQALKRLRHGSGSVKAPSGELPKTPIARPAGGATATGSLGRASRLDLGRRR